MTFFTERLALKEPPATAVLDPPGVAMVTVLDRIPKLAESEDRFKAFLASLSSFLQPPFTGDSLNWESQFGQGLIELEEEIRKAALSRAKDKFGREMSLDELAAAMDGSQPRDANVKYVVGGLLSDVLTKLENDYLRWPGTQRTRATTLNGFVNPRDFRTRLIREGRTWKDATVPWEHGEFSHRIQWGAGLAVYRDRNWGNHYTRIGIYEDDEEFGVGQEPRLVFGLWDAIVDRNPFNGAYQVPYLSASKFDFRAPENFQSWMLFVIKKDDVKNPIRLLSAFLYDRAEKRQAARVAKQPVIYMGVPNQAQWKAWCRRLFGDNVTLDGLTPEQKGELARAWVRLTKLDTSDEVVNPILVIESVDKEARREPSKRLLSAYKSLGIPPEVYSTFKIPPE